MFLLDKVTLLMMDHKISKYFNQFTKLLQHFLVFEAQWINNSRVRLEFKGNCLKQDKVAFTPNKVVNLFIFYELGRWSKDLNADFTLKDCLFGAVKITKNADTHKCSYSGYGIGFDSRSLFAILYFDCGKNFFGVDIRGILIIKIKIY